MPGRDDPFGRTTEDVSLSIQTSPCGSAQIPSAQPTTSNTITEYTQLHNITHWRAPTQSPPEARTLSLLRFLPLGRSRLGLESTPIGLLEEKEANAQEQEPTRPAKARSCIKASPQAATTLSFLRVPPPKLTYSELPRRTKPLVNLVAREATLGDIRTHTFTQLWDSATPGFHVCFGIRLGVRAAHRNDVFPLLFVFFPASSTSHSFPSWLRSIPYRFSEHGKTSFA